MADLAKLVVRLEAQTSKYIAELDKANAKLSRFESATKKSLSGIETAFKGLLAGVSVAVLGRTLVDLSDKYTQIGNRLRLVTTSTENLRKVEDALFASAQRTRTSFESTVDLYSRIARSSDQLGISQRELLKITETVNQAIVISGTTTQEAAAGVVQFGQALASGRLSGDELRSILENMPRLARALADGLGVSIGQLRKLGSEGALTADKVIGALQSQAPKIASEFGKINNTIGQSVTVLQNSLLKFVGQFSQSTFAGGLAKAITTLAENIEGLAKALLVAAAAAATFKAALVGQALASATKAFIELYAAVASGRAILLGSAAADRAKAAAAVQAAEAEVAQKVATLAAVKAEQAKAVVTTESTVVTDAGAVAALNAARADYARAAAATAATRAEQAKALVITETTVVTDAGAVAAVAAARAEHARVAAVLAGVKAEQARAIVSADAATAEFARLAVAKQVGILEAQEAAAKQALTAAEARLAAATVTTNNAQFARAAAARQMAALEAAEATAKQALTAAEARLAAATTTTNTAMFARAAAVKQVAALEAEVAVAQAGLAKAQSNAAKAAGASSGALGLLGGALGRVLGPFRALGALIAANPLSAIVAGAAAAVTALVVFSDKIKTSEDGVVTLRDTAIATWQLIVEGLAPIARIVADTFRAIADTVKETFGGIIDGAAKVKEALDIAFKFTPTGLIFGLLEDQAKKAFDKIQKRARKIAEERKAAQAGVSDAAGAPVKTAAAVDDKALKSIQDLERSLRQQIATMDQGAVATIKYRIAHGDLADEFKKAGAAADPYRRSLVELTGQTEALKLKSMANDLENQVAAFNLSGEALLRYRLEVGDLRNTYNDAGKAGQKFVDDLLFAARQLDGLQIARTLADINAQILELEGNTVDAIKIRIELDDKALRTQLQSRGDFKGLKDLERLQELKIAQVEFNALQTETQRIQEKLARQEERIRNSQETGAISEFKALEQIGEAREVAVAQLDTILNKQRAIAAASGNPELVRAVEQSAAELEKLASQVNLVGEAIQTAFEEHATAALEDFLTGVKSAEDAFRSFLRAIEQEIARFVARDLINRMFGDMFKNLGSGGGGGSNWGWVGNALGMAAGFFGGGGFSSVGSGAAANAAAAEAFAGWVPAMANGGRFSPNTPTLVGERGPELVIPRNSDLVVPNHDIPSMMRSQRPIEVIQNFNVTTQGGQVERRTLSQISAAAARGLSDGNRRNN